MDRRDILRSLAAFGVSTGLPLEFVSASPIVGGRPSSHFAGAMEFTIRPGQIFLALEHLRHMGRHADWIVLMFKTLIPSADSDDQWLNLQYSIEGNTVGLDWVLLGARNIADRQKIIDLCEFHNYEVMTRELNDVGFLRVERGPGGHPNSPACGHPKLLHPERGVKAS